MTPARWRKQETVVGLEFYFVFASVVVFMVVRFQVGVVESNKEVEVRGQCSAAQTRA